MDILNAIKARIENGWGHEIAWALYGLLRNKIGYVNLETEIPEIADYLNVMNLIDETNSDEAHNIMLNWIEWILKYLQDQPLDFIYDDNLLSQAYQQSQFVSKKEQAIKDEQTYNSVLDKKKKIEESNDPSILRSKARGILFDTIDEAMLLLNNNPNNTELKSAIDNAEYYQYNDNVATEDLAQATNILQQAMSNPYQVSEMSHGKHKSRPFNLLKYLKKKRHHKK